MEVGSREGFRVVLDVCECGDASLVYGCEVDEEHVHATRPSVRLLGGTLYIGDRCGVL